MQQNKQAQIIEGRDDDGNLCYIGAIGVPDVYKEEATTIINKAISEIKNNIHPSLLLTNKKNKQEQWEKEFEELWDSLELADRPIFDSDHGNYVPANTENVDEDDKNKLKQFISQTRQEAVEEERQRIFDATADLRIFHGKKENMPAYKLVNDTIRKIWLVLGAKQNKRGDFELKALSLVQKEK